MYKDFENRKIKTVGQLIEKLSKLPSDTKINSLGADCAGYDVSRADYICLDFDKEINEVKFYHLEHELFLSLQSEEITEEEYNKLTQ